ncbi:hypothetical protein [Streptomyces reniochalinae]|uniref:Uncharacterized protein n=1 Tax=Streptomyces reniochalinae TaxID=2250578 RepID=A0A367EGT1_9ACTN|nr:hypothetical protein [Streptomyces reniochalinae]RCG16969.1 hypothetical protein DQ392_17985 [Streptomyces reniochalinae]
MALYEITRTDDAKPGEFVSALVLASGTAKARSRVAHLSGVDPKGSNVKAERIDTTGADVLLTTEFDERDPEPSPADEVPALPDVDEPFTEVGGTPAPPAVEHSAVAARFL